LYVRQALQTISPLSRSVAVHDGGVKKLVG
jgi:hypothetical protein